MILARVVSSQSAFSRRSNTAYWKSLKWRTRTAAVGRYWLKAKLVIQWRKTQSVASNKLRLEQASTVLDPCGDRMDLERIAVVAKPHVGSPHTRSLFLAVFTQLLAILDHNVPLISKHRPRPTINAQKHLFRTQMHFLALNLDSC